MSKVLVTGANGFVGSHVLGALGGQEGVTVVAACRDPAKLPNDFTGDVRAGDLRDAAYRRAVVEGVDVICHAAAWTSLWGHADRSRTEFLEPTLALIDEARAAGVKRFINTSTTSAAAPYGSADAMAPGVERRFWPHLCNVVTIENTLRNYACAAFQVVNLRLGIFSGQRYALGLLPILVPRLKTHLVPWVAGGRTSLPLIDGRDIGQAFALASAADNLDSYESLNIVGTEVPSAREVISFLHKKYGLPLPHFSVPFLGAYAFAWLMERLDWAVPWEPLVTRSIVHLMEEVNVDNDKAARMIGYRPVHGWRESIRVQMREMTVRQLQPMSMAKPLA